MSAAARVQRAGLALAGMALVGYGWREVRLGGSLARAPTTQAEVVEVTPARTRDGRTWVELAVDRGDGVRWRRTVIAERDSAAGLAPGDVVAVVLRADGSARLPADLAGEGRARARRGYGWIALGAMAALVAALVRERAKR